MNRGAIVFQCPECEASAVADDDFCESCGTPLRRRRDESRDHVEVEAGPVAGVSDRGLRHERNEDAVYVAADGARAIAVVCDGVSVSAAPQVASQVAAQTAGGWLLDALHRHTVDDVDDKVMAECLVRGNDAVAAVPWTRACHSTAPSCTAVAAVWDGHAATLGWAGDSRAYWVDNRGAQLLTVDHSWAQDQIAAGEMTPTAAQNDPRAHMITRWLGGDAPDGAETTTWTPERPGRLVLCTDGLWNLLDGPEELARLVSSPGDLPLTLARELVSTALDRGGHDNVTVAVIDIEPAARG